MQGATVTAGDPRAASSPPQFNRLTTQIMAYEGPSAAMNHFDSRAWYPLGRDVGRTVFPGLMATAAALQAALNALGFPVSTRDACVFTAPAMASLTALVTYSLAREVSGRRGAGLVSAALIAVVPAYISRSAAGSFDNEGVAIFALQLTFFAWVKAVKAGSVAWAAAAALAYAFMTASWGGYVFVINVIPAHAIALVLSGRASHRLYVAYSVFYVIGSLAAMTVPFVGFGVLTQAEHAASHAVFLGLQVLLAGRAARAALPDGAFRSLLAAAAALAVVALAGAVALLQASGRLRWSGRSLSLLQPAYASTHSPIIASVSEHQPTPWTSYFMGLHAAVVLAPVGAYVLLSRPDDAAVFLALNAALAWYFSAAMVRLMLTLAPAACMLAGIAASELLTAFASHVRAAVAPRPAPEAGPPQRGGRAPPLPPAVLPLPVSLGAVALVFAGLASFSLHASHVASEAYSSPSIVLASSRADGSRAIFDDYREAFSWLRTNTPDDARVMSWWDYGYQIAALGNRTTVVDNNTWNNTHLATVGRAMAGSEERAYPILRSLGVDYVLVVFGGVAGLGSDDVNKLLWMVRIAGGVFPSAPREAEYFSGGRFRVDAGGSPALLNSLMYKLCYHRFDEVRTDPGSPLGFDRARRVVAGRGGIRLEHLEEVFTSEHWIVRVYRVRRPRNRRALPSAPSSLERARRLRWPPAEGDAERGGAQPRFRGCWADERAFVGRAYVGGGAGAQLALAAHAAAKARARFFAVARNGADGHSFVFRAVKGEPLPSGDPACKRGCEDDPKAPCGCADAACGDRKLPGQEHNRRWAVYEMPEAPKAD